MVLMADGTSKEITQVAVGDLVASVNGPAVVPLTGNGELIIVNGYLVGAGVDGKRCDYRSMKWRVPAPT